MADELDPNLIPDDERRRRALLAQTAMLPSGFPDLAAPNITPPAAMPPVPKIGSQQKELERIETSGSGISQIKNPWLRGIARAGDIIGSIAAPRIMAAIPGTSIHHSRDIAAQSGLANQEAGYAESQAKIAEQQATAGLKEQQTHGLKNPQDQPASNEVELFQKDPQQLEAYLKSKAQPDAVKPKSIEEQAYEYAVANGHSPLDALSAVYGAKNQANVPLPQQYLDAIQSGDQTKAALIKRTIQDTNTAPKITVEAYKEGNREKARDYKMDRAENADTNQLHEFESDMDMLARAANELKTHPGLKGITGMAGALPNIPGGAAADAQAKLQNLKSQTAFGALQKMRNASKTGGALGQVSERELDLLTNSITALDRAQSYQSYQQSLQGIMDFAEQAKARAREAVTRTYGGQQQPTSDGAVEEYERDPVTKKLVRKRAAQ